MERKTQCTDVRKRRPQSCFRHWGLVLFGWLNVGLGMIGVIVPGMPTTVFLLIALWAFSKSSERFYQWLWNHPRFGAALQSWHRERAIPRKVKYLAVGSMTASFILSFLMISENWMYLAALASILLAVAAYIVTRPDAREPVTVTD